MFDLRTASRSAVKQPAGTEDGKSVRPVAFAALRNRDFRGFFVGNMLSMMADNIEHVISYWVVFQLFRSPALLGFAVISHWLPFLAFSWYFGALADRFDCRRVIQASQFLFASVSLTWAILIYTDSLAMWHAAVLLIFHGMAGALWNPARQLLIYEVVGPETLQSGVRLLATGRQLGVLLGPAVGGGLMLLLGPTLGLVVNTLIFLPLIVWCQLVPYTGHAGRRTSRQQGWGEAFSALSGASSNRALLSMILLPGFFAFFVGSAFQAQMPGFALALGTDTMGYGYTALLAANGAGAVVGGILLESGGILKARASTSIVLAFFWCLAMGSFAAASYYPLALGLLFVAGILNLAFLAMAQTLVQLYAPVDLRGRLIGLYNMSAQGLRTFSGVSVGLLGSYIGIHWSLGLSTGAILLVTVVLFVLAIRSGKGPEDAEVLIT